MTEYSCYACHGLIVTWPVDDLAEWLDQNTPAGIHFNTVGGVDPQLYAGAITTAVIRDIDAGKQVIFIGHSMGAMLAYYLADDLKSAGLKAPLFIPIDPTDWGSNLPDTLRWSWSVTAAGRWAAPSNIGKWINYHQPSYPGGKWWRLRLRRHGYSSRRRRSSDNRQQSNRAQRRFSGRSLSYRSMKC